MKPVEYTRAAFQELLDEHFGQNANRQQTERQTQTWFARGDGAAVYQNHDFGSPNQGHIKIVSYGSAQAQLEGEPPDRLPDTGDFINWRYVLIGTYREP
jgi:hypothetical protein